MLLLFKRRRWYVSPYFVFFFFAQNSRSIFEHNARTEHNFEHIARILRVTLKSMMLKFSSIIYLTLPGSERVFSGTGIWPKYGAGFGKTQIISWREMGFDCYPLSGIHQNLGTGCGIFCLSVGNSEVVLTANASQAGVRSVVPPIRANCIELSW